MAIQFNFLKNAHTAELLDKLKSAINAQISVNNITEADIEKIIELINNTKRLKRALTFL